VESKRNANLNFHYPYNAVDEFGRVPVKKSAFKGVKWSNSKLAWQIDEDYFLDTEEE
jgi:hypothetical protein